MLQDIIPKAIPSQKCHMTWVQSSVIMDI